MPRVFPSVDVKEALCLLALGTVTLSTMTGAPAGAQPVHTSDHFAFHSDFHTNLNDALLDAGASRRDDRSELFHDGEEAACFDALPAVERIAWDRAVDFHAEAVASGARGRSVKGLIRLSLAGVVDDDDWEQDEERRLIEIARGMRTAAAPAYTACRWSKQDTANRRWISALAPLLRAHEQPIARRLAEVYQTVWQGLPLRVDVVEVADWSGAHTINLRPPGVHILITSGRSEYQGLAALEMVFHEACHFLTGREKPLRTILNGVLAELGDPFRGDLVHAVHFYMTGEVVRRTLEASGGTRYEPSIIARDIFTQGGFHGVVQSVWPRYLDGELDLESATRALVTALQTVARPRDEENQ